MAMRNVLPFFLLVALPATCLAQFETATVLGTVKDPSGAVIAGSRVTLEDVRTGVKTTHPTNEAGNFDFVNAPIGACRLRPEANGFRTADTDEP